MMNFVKKFFWVAASILFAAVALFLLFIALFFDVEISMKISRNQTFSNAEKIIETEKPDENPPENSNENSVLNLDSPENSGENSATKNSGEILNENRPKESKKNSAESFENKNDARSVLNSTEEKVEI
jgi:hypothetical protein